MKTYICSDLHIGHEAANYAKINQFLRLVQKDANRFIMLGDIYDLWVNRYEVIKTKEPMKSTHELLIQTIKKVPSMMVKGNHDSNFNDSNFCIVKPFVENKVMFCHGHELDPEQALASPFFKEIALILPELYQEIVKPVIQPGGADHINDYIKMINNITQKFAELKGYNYVIYGHTHYAMIQGKCINCGDFCGDTSYIIIENGKITLKRL